MLKTHSVTEIRIKLFDLDLSSDLNKQLIELIPGSENFSADDVEATLYTLVKKIEKLKICKNDADCKSDLVCPVCLKNGIKTNVKGKSYWIWKT